MAEERINDMQCSIFLQEDFHLLDNVIEPPGILDMGDDAMGDEYVDRVLFKDTLQSIKICLDELEGGIPRAEPFYFFDPVCRFDDDVFPYIRNQSEFNNVGG